MKAMIPLLLLLSGCGAAAGSLEACAIMKEADLPVTVASNSIPLVEVSLNGQPVTMAFDTGAPRTVISDAASKRLDLALDPQAQTMTMGIGGVSVHRDALIQKLELGTVARRNIDLIVVDMPTLSGKADGVLGDDVLQDYDLLLDLPHQRIALYRQRNCPGGQPDWPEAAERLPPVALGRAVSTPMVAAKLDGTSQNAVIDTGASFTIVDRGRALAAGVTEAMLDADQKTAGQGIAKSGATMAVHRFRELRIGSMVTRNPRIGVVTLGNMTGSTTNQMLIGNDYLRRHKLWIAYGDNEIYVALPAAKP